MQACCFSANFQYKLVGTVVDIGPSIGYPAGKGSVEVGSAAMLMPDLRTSSSAAE